MKYKILGTTDVKISAIGLGAMPLSLEHRPSEKDAIAVVCRALDLGVTLIDTADSYCIDENDTHHNERLIAKALKHYVGDASAVIVATKGGLVRPQGRWEVDGNPKRIRKTICESFEALGGKAPIALWQLHAPDDCYPLEETLAPVCAAVEEGLIRCVGLSNVSVDEIKRARRIVDVVSVQNQYNPWCRNPEGDGVLAYCEREGLTFLPWSPLGGSRRVHKLVRIPGLASMAEKKGVSPAELVLAWLMSKSPCVVPIPGASKIKSIEASAKALDVLLARAESTRIDQATWM